MKILKMLFMMVMVAFVSTIALAQQHASYAATGTQTHAVFYRDSSFDQPLIGARMDLNFDSGMPFWRFCVKLSEKTDPSILSNFKLYKTSVNYFAPARATLLSESPSVSEDGREIWFDVTATQPLVWNGDYVWVTTRVAEDAAPGIEIDAKIAAVHVNGYVCYLTNDDPTGAGLTYEFRRHVVPYYRMARVGQWNDKYYDVVSEVPFFYMGVNGDGSLYYGWEGGQYDETSFGEALNTLRDGRGDRPVRILLGIAHCASGLSEATRDDVKRARLVDQIVHYVEKFDFDGVDIDWEYPTSAEDWRGFEKLVAALRPRLFALGGGKMISSAMSNWYFYEATAYWGLHTEIKGLHQQLDMLNMMTYDNGTTDGHSPWWLHDQSKDFGTRLAGLPPVKVCVGVPFYTNEHYANGKVTWGQMGYDWVYYSFPQYVDGTDTFWHNGYMYSYNSIATIRKKGADLRKTGFGVMIWGYECDIPFENTKSLARALASTIRPNDMDSGSEIATPEQWGQMAAGSYVLAEDLVLTADDYRPENFMGTLDGQGYTVTLKSGGAAFPGGVEGTIKNVTFIVEGSLTGNSAVVDSLNSNGRIENVTVIVKEGATISGSNSVGALAGDIWVPNKGEMACVKDCIAEIHGTLTTTGYGRVGGVVGNMNLGAYTLGEDEHEPARIQGCRAEIYATAMLTTDTDSEHAAVGGLVANGNTARECVMDNSVVIYKGATLRAKTGRVAAVTPGSLYGRLLRVSNNWASLEEGVDVSADYADHILDVTIGVPDRKTKTAMVEYRDRVTGVSFRVRQAVLFVESGYTLRLR